jgi:hypothetical protein
MVECGDEAHKPDYLQRGDDGLTAPVRGSLRALDTQLPGGGLAPVLST